MIEFKVTGLDGLERALRQLPQEVAGKVLSAALRKASQPMADVAKQMAPRSDTPSRLGHMGDSIALRVWKDSGTTNDLEANLWMGPDRNHFYGLFQEFGSRSQSARPFMRPAFDTRKDQVIADLGTELWAGIERAAKRLAK